LICQITKLIYSWKQKHPEKDTIAIDYGLATVMLPTVLLGSFIGTFVTILVPPIVLQVLLTALLTFLTVQSALKAKQIYEKENLKIKKAKEAAEAKERAEREKNEKPTRNSISVQDTVDGKRLSINRTSLRKTSRMSITDDDDSSRKLLDSQGPTQEEIDKVDAMLEREKTHWQWDKHAICLVVLIS
jgi:hypothetical protein